MTVPSAEKAPLVTGPDLAREVLKEPHLTRSWVGSTAN